ncbi:MAG TPA: aromatic-ring-hydroxylating dioxygenase subunit beta [Gaiellaceae bacterium]|nr:aromatic-ring-hydroxylating dioxygenase subunit beta [Gaiellaceae bacterium]
MQAETPTSAFVTSAAEADIETYFTALQWLHHEAELLDDNRITEWFELIDQDIDYRVPIRVTRERAAGPGFSTDGWHMFEDYGSLAARVARLETEYAWAEDPPSRTRRLVTNVRAARHGDGSLIEVKSNLLIYRGRYDAPEFNLIAGERHDTLRRSDDRIRLLKRMVLLDQATVATHNLAIFL